MFVALAWLSLALVRLSLAVAGCCWPLAGHVPAFELQACRFKLSLSLQRVVSQPSQTDQPRLKQRPTLAPRSSLETRPDHNASVPLHFFSLSRVLGWDDYVSTSHAFLHFSAFWVVIGAPAKLEEEEQQEEEEELHNCSQCTRSGERSAGQRRAGQRGLSLVRTSDGDTQHTSGRQCAGKPKESVG